MARRFIFRGLLAALLLFCILPARAQIVVDRVAAHIEGDVILESEVRELGLYQQLAGGKADSRGKLLTELIEQWIVKTEAAAAIYPRPTQAEADRALADLERHLASPEAFQARLRELELTTATVRAMLTDQLYMSRYLDYKFRPATQVEATDIEKYYREELIPALQQRGQPAPSLDSVREQIRELLIQQEISRRAAQWLTEARSRLKIEVANRNAADAPKQEKK